MKTGAQIADHSDYGTLTHRPTKWLATSALAFAAFTTPWTVPAAHASIELAGQRHCLGCHHATQRRAGPPFKAIAERYAPAAQGAQRQTTLDLLGQKIRRGGKGAWGVVPMPANPQVTEAEGRALAAWILDTHR